MIRPRRHTDIADDMAASTLSASGLLEEAHVSALPRLTIMAVFLGLIGFLAWAGMTPVYEIVSGSGAVRPVGLIQRIDHLDGGTVAHVAVSEGQQVQAGDILMELDPTGIDLELAKLQLQEADLARDLHRHTAFLLDLENGLPGGLTMDHAVFASELASEAAHFLAQMELRRSERQVLLAEYQTAGGRLANLEEDFTILSAYAARLQAPGARAAVSRVQVEGVAREVVQKKGEITRLTGERDIISAKIRQSDARERELLAGFRRNAASARAETDTALRIVRQSIAQLREARARTVIHSPADGTLLALAFSNARQVVPPGGLIAELVPQDSQVFAEVEISAERIGTIRPGSPASIKVLSHDFTRFGDLDATVQQVSPSSFVKPDGSTVFRVRLSLDETFTLASGAPDPRRDVLPGMTVTADIRTGRKTVLSYMLKPLRTLSDRAFSES